MSAILRNRTLYVVNFALLVTHEIDAAYWQEWRLVGISDGIQIFLVTNFLLAILALWGLVLVTKRMREGLYFALGMAAAGVVTGGFHTYWIMIGGRGFSLPVSVGLIGAVFLVSLLQAGKAADSLWFSRTSKTAKAERTLVRLEDQT